MLIRASVIALIALLPAYALAQAGPTPMLPPRPQSTADRVAERIGSQLGALMIENAGLRAQIEDLQNQLETMRKREAERKPPDHPSAPQQ